MSAVTEDRSCVVCGKRDLVSTGFNKNLGDLLNEWEAYIGAPFPVSVREDCERDGGRIELYRCADCLTESFFPLKPGTSEFYGHILQKEYYIDSKWEFDFAVEKILAHGARSVFDYGCGSGHFLSQLVAGRNIRAFGYDFGSNIEADNKGFTCVTTPTLEALGGVQVDALCLFQVLEHVADPYATISEALLLLRSGGLVIVAVPDNAGAIRHYPSALTNLPPHHVTRWRAESLSALAERAGLDIEAVRYERLPSYLWHMYLPVMLAKGPLPLAGRVVNQLGLTEAFLNALEWIGLRELPGVRGHTVLMVARKR